MTRSHDARVRAGRALLLAIVTSLVAACGGGGYGGGSSGSPGTGSRYASTLLASDQAGSPHLESQLIDPWDLAAGGGAKLGVSNHGSTDSILLSAVDLSLPVLAIGVPPGNAASARSTGVAFNPANGFEVSSDGHIGVARFIVASEGGTLSGWAPSLGLDQLVVAFDGSAVGAVYAGLAMTSEGVDSVLLAADFHNRVIDTFGPDFAKRPGGGRFVDPALPAGYAPFGITVQRGLVYVTYSQPDASGHTPRNGAGLGLVNAFSLTGQLVQRLVPAGSTLNAPWSAALAPADFGAFGGALLVANAGNGTVSAFDATSGQPLGLLTGPDGAALVIDGLHRILFGNGTVGQPPNALFFTAGPQGGTHGRFGRIDLQ